jgi:hypothetical protein
MGPPFAVDSWKFPRLSTAIEFDALALPRLLRGRQDRKGRHNAPRQSRPISTHARPAPAGSGAADRRVWVQQRCARRAATARSRPGIPGFAAPNVAARRLHYSYRTPRCCRLARLAQRAFWHPDHLEPRGDSVLLRQEQRSLGCRVGFPSTVSILRPPRLGQRALSYAQVSYSSATKQRPIFLAPPRPTRQVAALGKPIGRVHGRGGPPALHLYPQRAIRGSGKNCNWTACGSFGSRVIRRKSEDQ